MARVNKIQYIILGLLCEGSKTGYEIKKRIEEQMSHYWAGSFGQIYPTLKKLESEGFVTKESFEDGGRQKIVYDVTKEGQEEFVSYLKMPVEEEMHKYEILVKLSFGMFVPLEVTKKNVLEFRNRNIVKLEQLKEIKSHMAKMKVKFKGIEFVEMTISCGLHVTSAMIAWSDETIENLEKMED